MFTLSKALSQIPFVLFGRWHCQSVGALGSLGFIEGSLVGVLEGLHESLSWCCGSTSRRGEKPWDAEKGTSGWDVPKALNASGNQIANDKVKHHGLTAMNKRHLGYFYRWHGGGDRDGDEGEHAHEHSHRRQLPHRIQLGRNLRMTRENN